MKAVKILLKCWKFPDSFKLVNFENEQFFLQIDFKMDTINVKKMDDHGHAGTNNPSKMKCITNSVVENIEPSGSIFSLWTEWVCECICFKNQIKQWQQLREWRN